jgi:hypothetical protein
MSEEIQIRMEVEKDALKDTYSALSSGSYHPIYQATKDLAERHERLLRAYVMLQKAFLDFNEIRNQENHILVLSPGETKIIELSDN